MSLSRLYTHKARPFDKSCARKPFDFILIEATTHIHASVTCPDQINEYASMVVLQVGQLVGEVGEVVAHASLQVLADVMIDRGQDAAVGLIDIRQAKLSDLGQ